jgi:two-component system copper resistance phosphate regulon response regulator CusR
MRLLIIEDNQKMAGYIKQALERKSYAVDCAFEGTTGEQQALFGQYDLIILDIMVPGKDGLAICRSLREEDVVTPILMLTAKGELDDKVEGLDCGADDYLSKPFELAELLARIRALLRRPTPKIPELLTAGDLCVNTTTYLAQKAGQQLSLTLKEYTVLECLLRNRGGVLTREQLLEHCWDDTFDSFSNIVDVYIKRLRKKLNDTDQRYIKTIRGVGYQFQG